MATEVTTAAPEQRKLPFLARTTRPDVGGFLYVENRLIDDYLNQIGPAGVTIYLMLAREISVNDYPSIAYIRQATRLNHSSVNQALRTLQAVGLINLNDLQHIEGTEQHSTKERELAQAIAKENEHVESRKPADGASI